ncbi:HAD family hydrolase [Nonomuraea soli]|uniref:Putative hydrolase of the HAD superfamily n=1 Tax=Nonomuraea soli TaxID=1032476 RepID=A0A7W0CFY8_9ACTN|nr:HAD family phosphatase [Nonomuraea soli]MBA2890481.1 putative hydrolase of the HAD superfamily [Nonomuraea soli]
MTWIVFDYGNVISADADLWPLIGHTGLEPERFHEAYWRRRLDYDRGDLDSWEYWSHTLDRDVDDDEVERLVELDIAAWSTPNEGTLAILRELQERGTSVGLLSNAPASTADGWDRLPWIAAIERRFYSGRLGMVKPDLEIFEHVAAELGTKDIVFIDDRADNVEGANRAGLTGVLFTGADQLREHLSLM